jgi:heterodisulfide reductase subunit C
MSDQAGKDLKPLTFRYLFSLGTGLDKEFTIRLERKTLSAIPTEKKSYPEWTELSFRQCPTCPLQPQQHQRCPIAVNLTDVVEFFRDALSHEQVDVLVETEARGYTKRTTLQEGVSSIIGIYMVTSGCPVMDKLRPMVRTHLPFATVEETMYRVLSMYLLAQYFLAKRVGEPDWELKRLVEIYQDVENVNKHFRERLSAINVNDATVNALVNLNCFADFTAFAIEENRLDEIELLFQAYLK